MIGRDQLTQVIDDAIERFRGRDLVTSVEVVDVLLDLRLILDADIADEALQELLDEPAATPAT